MSRDGHRWKSRALSGILLQVVSKNTKTSVTMSSFTAEFEPDTYCLQVSRITTTYMFIPSAEWRRVGHRIFYTWKIRTEKVFIHTIWFLCSLNLSLHFLAHTSYSYFNTLQFLQRTAIVTFFPTVWCTGTRKWH